MRKRRKSMQAQLAMNRISDEATEFRKQCAQCNRTLVKCRRCAGCYSVAYCSRECQRLHWRSHKGECESLYGMIGQQECGSTSSIAELETAVGLSSIDKSFGVVIPSREESASDAEWTLISDSDCEEEELV